MTLRPAPALIALTATALAVMLGGCQDSPPPAASATTTPTATSASPSPTATSTPPVTARAQARALARQLQGRPLDVTYRIKRSNPDQPGGTVRIQRVGQRYRVDVTRGSSTSSLRTAPRGLVSCLRTPNGRSCFLVAKPGDRPPVLFNPGLQRIVTQAMPTLARGSASVRRDGTWRAPQNYGQATCFKVKGKNIDDGRYCLLNTGRFAGTPVYVRYKSGRLVAISIDARVSPGFIVAPVNPTPLPN